MPFYALIQYCIAPQRAFVIAVLIGHACVLGVAPAEHGNWRFQYLTNPDGVWVNEVASLTEDDSGAIWAATWGEGIQRISDATWETFNERSGFVGDWQYSVTRDTLGGIWVGTGDGMCHIQGNVLTNMTTENTPALDTNEIRVIRNDSSGNLLIGTGSGTVYRCLQSHLSEPHPQAWELIISHEQSSGAAIMDLLETASNQLWVSLKFQGMRLWEDNMWRVPDMPRKDRSFRFSHFEDGQVAPLVSHTFGGDTMWRFEHGEWIPSVTVAHGVGGFARAKDGTLYIGTSEGLFRQEGDDWHSVDLGEEIGTPNIRSILIDKTDTLWLGCEEGLIRGTRNSWEAHETTGEYGTLLRVLPQPKKGAPVLGITSNGYLVDMGPEGLSPRLNLGPALQGNFKSATVPFGDRLWAIRSTGDTVGISVHDGSVLERVPPPTGLRAISSPHMKLFRGHEEDLFLLGDAGVQQLRSGAWVPVPTPPTIRDWDRVLVMAMGPNKSYYLGGDDGIFYWDGKQALEDLGARYQIETTDTVHAILAHPSGEVWIGTQGSGVYVLGADSARHISRRDGLRSDMISGLYATDQDTVWVVYRRQGLGTFRNGHWLNYGYPQGLHNTAITALFERENGSICLFDTEGSRFEYHPDRTAPETQILVGPETIDTHGRAVFSYAGWDGWDHTPRNRLGYATRITRGDGTVVVPWSPFLETTSWVAPVLRHGRYQFSVRASDEDGNIDLTPATAWFRVSPPLWMRPQFAIPLVVAALFSLVMLIVRFQHFRQLKISQDTIFRSNQALKKEVAERAKVEQELRESEARLEEAQALARIGSWGLNPKTGQGTWSPEMYRLFGRAPADGPPTFKEFMECVHPDDREGLMGKHRKLIEQGVPFETEFRSNPKNGSVLHFFVRVKGDLDADGNVYAISGATQDITAGIRAREEQKALEEKMRQSQKLEALGQLTGGIAHDFNNILHALLGFCNLAQLADPDDRTTVKGYLDDIEVGIKRAADLVRQLLTFSRREQMERSPIALAPLIEEALKLVRSTLPATIVIQSSIEESGGTVFADSTQIHQIILNLCTNAAHAMEEQGGTLWVSTTPVSVSTPTLMNTGELAAGDYMRLSIGDTGTGMKPDVVTRIFDPFFTTKETGSGTGLGLTTVHGIVMSMQGAIDVETAHHQGTTFHVYLRRSPDDVPEPGGTLEREIPNTPVAGCILLVDDEGAIVSLARRMLERRDIAVDCFERPVEALEAFERDPNRYSLVLTDLTMPGMTGLKLAEKVRRLRNDIPILLMSGNADTQTLPPGLINAVLRKPIEMATFITAIQQYSASPSGPKENSG